MKKLLISMLVLTTLVTMVGCNDKKTGDTNSKPVENEQVANDSEIKKGRSNDEMYEIYEELLPSMRSYYESLGVDLKEDKSDKAKDYNSATGISYTNYDNNNIGEFSVLDYGLAFDKDGTVDFLAGSMYMNINAEEYKDGNFKFEETPFYELSKIFGADELDYTSINEKVNDYFKGNGSDVIQREKGQYSERINLSNSQIAYMININP
ncbi:hypothetical protein [uncultured Clostridium sp.]|mgnify:CR=1 FL=1|uniref:hypothetical protein n=1 Tax=uncultured Clostridium sp. TaxID=59620 RepID=UPI0025D8AB1B|nr:hypothetical protein [uncultured Clostridium sp.]